MSALKTLPPKDPGEFPNWQFGTLDIEYQAETQSIWMNHRTDAPQCYTLLMLLELLQFRDSLRNFYHAKMNVTWPCRYLVMASKKADVFSLGGDLESFSTAIRNNDLAKLRIYAHACVDLVYSYSRSLDLPIVTLAAVHGQCLGGAMEAAMAFDFIIAEENAMFGLPEVMFNTFPGMGAVTMLSRKVGPALAQRIILEGRSYSGRQMYDLEIVDALAAPGNIRSAARSWMAASGETSWRRRRVIAEARRRAHPITYDELIRITDLWAETSCRIGPNDLRHMERLIRAQRRLSHMRSPDAPSDCSN